MLVLGFTVWRINHMVLNSLAYFNGERYPKCQSATALISEYLPLHVHVFTVRAKNGIALLPRIFIDISEIEGYRYKQRKSTHPRFRVDKYDVFSTNCKHYCLFIHAMPS